MQSKKWWHGGMHNPTIPASWEAEEGGWSFQAPPGQVRNSMRLCLKIKNSWRCILL